MEMCKMHATQDVLGKFAYWAKSFEMVYHIIEAI